MSPTDQGTQLLFEELRTRLDKRLEGSKGEIRPRRYQKVLGFHPFLFGQPLLEGLIALRFVHGRIQQMKIGDTVPVSGVLVEKAACWIAETDVCSVRIQVLLSERYAWMQMVDIKGLGEI